MQAIGTHPAPTGLAVPQPGLSTCATDFDLDPDRRPVDSYPYIIRM